jgi:hypothetical protein
MMPAEPVLTRINVKNSARKKNRRKYLGIPRNLQHPVYISTKKAGGSRGAHIYRLNAKCHPQKKK